MNNKLLIRVYLPSLWNVPQKPVPAATAIINNLTAGTYIAYIKDSLGRKDTITVEITQPTMALTVSATTINAKCYNDNNGSIVLNATTAATSGTLNWTTSGTGVFTNGNTLTPTYIPSLADNISGSVTLTISNFDPGNTCQTVNDAMVLTINQLAIADAGLDQTVCSSNDTVSLIGNISGAVTKGSWRTLGSGLFTNSSSLITNYILSSNDKSVGFVKLILTSKDPIGPCNSANDTMIVTINSKATADALKSIQDILNHFKL